MPCYSEHLKVPSRLEYEHSKSMGYQGTFEDYSAMCAGRDLKIFICGDLGPHCADCMGFGDFLCDYPVGDGKTCDRPMCSDHSHGVGLDIHYCETHFRMWKEFKESGGVDSALRNVIAIRSEN